MLMSKEDAAVAWARRGFRVFPCLPDEPGREGNAKRAKKPAWEGWTEWATNDEATIRAWWQGYEWNIGVLTTDMLAVDIDTKPGRDGMASWMKVYGGFDTLTVRTPSGGLHLYYMGANVALNQGALGAGLDIRSHHGYVLAPGSTVDGVPYRVEIDQPMAQAPREVVSRCKPPGERAANAQHALVDLDSPAAIHAAVSIVNDAPAAMEGERSEAAYKLACRVRDHGVSEAMCRHIMAPWGERSAVVGDDLHMRIGNAYAYAQNASGAKHPEVLFSGINVPEPPPLISPETMAAERVASARSRFKLETLADCEAEEDGAYIVKGALTPGSVNCVYGPPNSGKSVFASHLAMCVAQGREFFGRKVTATRTLYIASENPRSIRRRLRALRQQHGDTPDLLLIGATPDLFNASGDAEAIMQIVQDEGIGLVVLDVLADAFPGMDENSNTGMGRVVQVAKMWAATGAAVILVHHVAKDHGGTPRGHGSLLGALDWGVLVEPDAETGTVSAKWWGGGSGGKIRDGAGAAVQFRNEVVPLGKDRDGERITTVVCREMTAAEIRAERDAQIKGNPAKVHAEAVRIALSLRAPNAAPGDPLPSIPCDTLKEACTAARGVLDAETDKGRSRAYRTAVATLEAKGRLYREPGTQRFIVYGWGDGDPVEFNSRPDVRDARLAMENTGAAVVSQAHASAIVGSMRGGTALKVADFGIVSIPAPPSAPH